MAKAPCYVIHRRVYPDGTEDFRVQTGWCLWWRTWIYGYDGGFNGEYGCARPVVYKTREKAERAAREHWRDYISSLPAMMREERTYDPMEAQQ